MTTTTTILIWTLVFLALGFAALFGWAMLKLSANKKQEEDENNNESTTTANEKDGDSDETDTDKNGEGTSTTSEEEVKSCTCTEAGALKKAEAADKKATEAADAAKAADEKAEAADEKATKALEANQATDKKVEEEKAREAEEKRQATIAKNAEEIDLYVLRFSQAYSDYATAVLRRTTKEYTGKDLAEKAGKASKKLCTSESDQICKNTDYGYAGELKRTGYQNIGARQRNGEEIAADEQSKLDENELNAFCDADNANADFETANAEAAAANAAIASNNEEVSNFKGVADSAVTAMKAAYEALVACKLNDDEIADKVNLSVEMLKVIVA